MGKTIKVALKFNDNQKRLCQKVILFDSGVIFRKSNLISFGVI